MNALFDRPPATLPSLCPISTVYVERDWDHDWSVRTDADGDWKLEVPRVPVQDDEGAAPGEG